MLVILKTLSRMGLTKEVKYDFFILRFIKAQLDYPWLILIVLSSNKISGYQEYPGSKVKNL